MKLPFNSNSPLMQTMLSSKSWLRRCKILLAFQTVDKIDASAKQRDETGAFGFFGATIVQTNGLSNWARTGHLIEKFQLSVKHPLQPRAYIDHRKIVWSQQVHVFLFVHRDLSLCCVESCAQWKLCNSKEESASKNCGSIIKSRSMFLCQSMWSTALDTASSLRSHVKNYPASQLRSFE